MTIYALALALTGFLGAVLALYLQHLYEKWVQKRNERELENEFLLRVGFDDLHSLPGEYRKRLAQFYDGDCND